jgi:hypothetical protein
MPFYQKGAVRIYFEEAGSGFPLLLIPGGGLDSAISFFTSKAPFNPIEEFNKKTGRPFCRLCRLVLCRKKKPHAPTRPQKGPPNHFNIAAAEKLCEARSQQTYFEYRSWVDRNFKIKETQAKKIRSPRRPTEPK